MKREGAQTAMAQTLAEMLGRLTPGEKKEFARLVDLDELMQLKADDTRDSPRRFEDMWFRASVLSR
ncbi:MAG TPA: hypothetical protein EYP49_16780 [Anaerolineae bacterium]|nr:hypothetical protein [Anaerolineae bacterium]